MKYTIIFLLFLSLESFTSSGAEIALSENGAEWLSYLRSEQVCKKFSIPTYKGIQLITDLRKISGQTNTTNNRREKKSVLRQESWNSIQNFLKEQSGIHFVSREHEDPGKIRATVTFYGLSARFFNHGIMTKLRMRVRFYMTYQQSPSGEISAIMRSEASRTSGILELKIKNPSPSEEHSVHKYRISVPDALLIRLFSVRPGSRNAEKLFSEILEESEKKKLNPPGQDKMLLDTIHFLAKRNPAFLKPLWVISYNRKALAFDEKQYPLAVTHKKEKSGLFSRFFKKTRPVPPDQKFLSVQYQITMDENVRFHRPVWHKKSDFIPLDIYFRNDSGTAFAAYPKDSVTVEFKVPAPVAWYGRKDRSRIHNILHDRLLIPMKDQIIQGFSMERGKAGHLNTWLKEAESCPEIYAIGQDLRPPAD
ncbi:MAG: hypothetical protein H6618_02455 [Deltaproteobacteria bacterium]|nr:hypothetical protein [Deltaproteobacteria bacterium]